jgi:PPOX class probable F420-dependent enzyme
VKLGICSPKLGTVHLLSAKAVVQTRAVTRDEAIARVREARVGRLATVRPDGSPHVVPFVFVIVGNQRGLIAYWTVDAKPKKRGAIQRIENIEANPAIEFVVDGYDEDWAQLWWVRVTGRARVVSSAKERTKAFEALTDKYPQYRADPPVGMVIAIQVDDVTSWASAEPSSPGSGDQER